MINDKKLWGGRFTGTIDPLMKKYNDSLPYDKILFAEDILCSQIYAQHLIKCNVLTEDEAKAICNGLSQIQTEWEAGEMDAATDEDVHSANERRLGEIIGLKTAGKLHTGRSRNDQVATDLRLWLRKKTTEAHELLRSFILTLVRRAKDERHVLMPGYTHLQRAQPIRWAHWLLAYADFFASDSERLQQILPRIDRMPLGVGALAGHAFGIDRVSLAKGLNFSSTIDNSLVAVADRDFIVEWLMWATLFMNHVSKMSEDLIIYSSSEFGFVKLSDAYSTGSSLMPQKRNPDALELLRGKSGRVFGHCSGFLMTTKGLPLSYNKDLQEDKEPLFDCVATCINSIRIALGVIETLSIDPSKMEAALTPDMLATDLAEYLVRKGVPFRESHHIVGSVVRLAEEKNTTIASLSLDEFRSCMDNSSSNCIGEDIFAVFNYKRSVESRNSRGGTSEQSILDQIQRMYERVGKVDESSG